MRYVVIGAGWLWGLAALAQVTDADVEFGAVVMLFMLGGIVAISWVGYSCAVPGVFCAPRVRWLWSSVPAVPVVAVLLCCTHHDLAVRVWLCDSELREYAEPVRRNPDSASYISQNVGLFRVRKTTADEKQVMLHTSDGFMTSSGIVYRPDGTPPEYRDRLGSCRFEHLYGPWWRFRELQD
jgi:hypothetical protein